MAYRSDLARNASALKKVRNPLNGGGDENQKGTTYTPGQTDGTFDYSQSSKQLKSKYEGERPKIGSRIKSVAKDIKSEAGKLKSEIQTFAADKDGSSRHKIAKELRKGITPNVEVDPVKGTKTRYRKGSEHTKENIIVKKEVNRPKIEGERITHKSNLGDTRTKTKYFKHGKAKGQVKSVKTETVTGKNKKEVLFHPKLNMNLKTDTESKESKTKYSRKGEVKEGKSYSDVSRSRFKPTTAAANVAKNAGGVAVMSAASGATVIGGIMGLNKKFGKPRPKVHTHGKWDSRYPGNPNDQNQRGRPRTQ